MNARTCDDACVADAALMTRSLAISTNSPFSIKNRSARCDSGSAGRAAFAPGGERLGGEHLPHARPAARSSSGSCARCPMRWMIEPEREYPRSHALASASMRAAVAC